MYYRLVVEPHLKIKINGGTFLEKILDSPPVCTILLVICYTVLSRSFVMNIIACAFSCIQIMGGVATW
jgi:hypothetical protein